MSTNNKTKNKKAVDDMGAKIGQMLIKYEQNRLALAEAKAKAEDLKKKAEDMKKVASIKRSKFYLARAKLVQLNDFLRGALPPKGEFDKKLDLAALPKIDNVPKGKIDVAKMRELSQKLSKM